MVHIGAPNCFDRPTAIGLASPVTSDNISMAFTALDGQIVTFAENSTNATFTRKDSNNGGCAAGVWGRVPGINMPYTVNRLNGASTTSAQGILTWQATSLTAQRKH
jgi:hypothetical protein